MSKDLYKNKYRIKSTRLENWDYSEDWWYFITICVKDFRKSLGKVNGGKVVLNKFGEIVKEQILGLKNHYPCGIDEYIIMPNHIHFIIILKNNDVIVETGLKPVSTKKNKKKYSLSELIRGFKTFSAKKINILKHSSGKPFWQKDYYEHIIRNEVSLEKIRLYIRNNPVKWDLDEYY